MVNRKIMFKKRTWKRVYKMQREKESMGYVYAIIATMKNYIKSS
jgi:hypothetical protein